MKKHLCNLIVPIVGAVSLTSNANINHSLANVESIDIGTIITNTNMGLLLTKPTPNTIMAFINNQIMSTQYKDLINDLEIDGSIGGSQTTVKVAWGTKYIGSVNIVYTISVKQNLSNIQLLNNGEINSLSNPYSTIPADGEILNALLNLDNDLRINQLYIFSIQYDETHTMTGSDYSGAHSVIVKPYENSNIYTGSLEVFFCTSKMNIADDCTVNSISIPSYYTLSNIPTNTLLTKIIVSNPNITTSKLAGTSYSLAKGASNITLTINNSNQYYNVSQVTLTVNTTNLDTCKAWNYTLDQVLANSDDSGWDIVGDNTKGTLSFFVIDENTKEVNVCDSGKYKNVSPGVNARTEPPAGKISTSKLTLGTRIISPDGKIYRCTGFVGSDAALVWGGAFANNSSLIGTITIPSSYGNLVKDIFRATKIQHIVFGNGWNSIPNSNTDTCWFMSTTLQSIDFPETFTTTPVAANSNIYSATQYAFRNTTQVLTGATFSSRTIYVPDNLIDAYKASSWSNNTILSLSQWPN